ncbi:hypothetical protein B0H14DRAFT_3455265 [Mycena olivaceomarginata]|nr:hypothetical protein B0H14DRAFT_3455265 [Mycena olivaceomarginata]
MPRQYPGSLPTDVSVHPGYAISRNGSVPVKQKKRGDRPPTVPVPGRLFSAGPTTPEFPKPPAVRSPVREKYKVLFYTTYDIPLAAQISNSLRPLAPNGTMRVIMPIADPDAPYVGGTNKYGGPDSVLLIMSDNAGADAIVNQRSVGVHATLGFWPHDVAANANAEDWTFSHHDAVGHEVGGASNDKIEAYARAGMVRTACLHPTIPQYIDQATQAMGGERDRRVFDALNSHIDAQLMVHHDGIQRIIVYYMKPLPGNAVERQELHNLPLQ